MARFFIPNPVRTSVQWAASLAVVAAGAGCANIKDDRTRTRAEGLTVGAGIGAIVGAGVGAFTGYHGAAIAGGTAAGSAIGRAFGESVVEKKEAYARTESGLDARIAAIRRQTASRRAYNGKLRGMVARREGQLASLLASKSAPGTTVEEFDLRTSVASTLREVDLRASAWQAAIAGHKEALRRRAEDARSATAAAELDALSREEAALQRERERLMSIEMKLKR
jgi:uncharacterized protein YcfJ